MCLFVCLCLSVDVSGCLSVSFCLSACLQGFEWNKYNQTHYDTDNPPPKIVQGYKFNVREAISNNEV